jgi:nucleotide-binding universal stress UspA family protein
MSHPFTSPYTLEDLSQKVGEKLQASVANPELAGRRVEYEVRRGKRFVEIIIAARAWQADLIVVGTGSRTEYPFLGSTSERILRKALVPVMVAKKPLSSEAKTFLVPTDFSSCARSAAVQALRLAKSFSGRVVLFHVFDIFSSFNIAYAHELGVSVPTTPPSPEEIEPEWEAFLADLPLENVDWDKCTEEGQAAATIVHQAKRMQADMIVIGTHGRSGSPHLLLGSVTEKVVRAAPCSVLTIRPDSYQFELP